MKKVILFICVYIMFLLIPISNHISTKAEGDIVRYQIYMDSNDTNSLAIKDEVNTILEYICDGVAEESYTTMVSSNLALFENIKDSKVKWKNAVLMIKIGNGKGTFIKGEYEKDKVCLEEVKPKSKIMEWLGIN